MLSAVVSRRHCCRQSKFEILQNMDMDPDVQRNRIAWEAASQKRNREYQDLLLQARGESTLLECELDLLRPLLLSSPAVIHLQSGCGLDDIGLVAAGAQSVVGVDFSQVAASSAQRRAVELAAACRYVVAEVPDVPLPDQCADLVYTGKGALIWMRDLTAWATDAARLLRPWGHLFIYESHPAVPLWTWDEDVARIRADRDYFGRCHVNDTYPARGAVEWQWTLGQIINAVISAGLEVLHVSGSQRTSPRPHGEDGSRTRSCCSHGAAAEHLTRSPATLSLTLLAEGVLVMDPTGRREQPRSG